MAYEYNCVGELDYESVTLPGNAGSGAHAYRYDGAGRLVNWDNSATTPPEPCPALAGSGGSGVSVSDNFNRANSTDLGSAWTERSLYTGAVVTDWSIAANQVTVTPGWSAAVNTTPAAGDTQFAEMTVHNVANTEYVGPVVRMSSNGTQGYVVVARAGTNEVRLYRIASGLIFLDSQSLPTSPEGKTLRLEASGSTLTIKVDGTSVLTYTDSTYLGAGNRNVGLVSNAAEGDNFASGDLGAGPPPAVSGVAYTWSYAQPGSPTETYTFDAGGRMTLVSDGAVSSAFGYDGLDRVTARNGTPFTYAGAATDPVSVGAESFTWAAGGLVTVTASGSVSFPLVDRHGDLIARFAADGTLSGSASFDPYGEPTGVTGTATVLGYQSDYTDPSTGHVWMAARWYQPTSGTFLSRDTVFGEVQTPFSLNRYTYTVNNPIRFWDPTGRSWEYSPEVYADCYTMACRNLKDQQSGRTMVREIQSTVSRR